MSADCPDYTTKPGEMKLRPLLLHSVHQTPRGSSNSFCPPSPTPPPRILDPVMQPHIPKLHRVIHEVTATSERGLSPGEHSGRLRCSPRCRGNLAGDKRKAARGSPAGPGPSPTTQPTHFPSKRRIRCRTERGAHSNESLITKLLSLIAFVWPR